MPAVTPTQTVADLMSTIPCIADCCGKGVQEVSMATINALRAAASNAADDEECLHRLLARCRIILRHHLIRCQVQADTEAAMNGKPHDPSEDALTTARELLAAVESRLGVNDD